MAEQKKIKVPDIGGATNVDVIEILIKKGDHVSKDTSLITLESDKASMEIPSPQTGVVQDIYLKVGDKVSEGDDILSLLPQDDKKEDKKMETVETTEAGVKEDSPSDADLAYAGPAVRRLARELGVDLAKVQGSGPKERIVKEDIEKFAQVKKLPKTSSEDTYTQPLNKIKRLTGMQMHNAWTTVPHVTQFEDADITDLEDFRKKHIDNAKEHGYKLTLLAFVCKIVSKALMVFPQFNSSLAGDSLIYKNYYNIGIAVDTPNGLVVPVIKGVNNLSVSEIAQEMTRLSHKAREKGLTPGEMQEGCFTISSLGGIGGTYFTPIVNIPEVAILGLSKATIKPVFSKGEFKPRLMLPLSLSYDHRVIDGAEAARFISYLSASLADLRTILL